MSEQRPQRDEGASALTGVCAGLGAYTRVDPVVWRVAFAMTALAGGTGVLLYGLAWMLMPRPGDGSSTAEQLLNRQLPAVTAPLALGAGLGVAAALSLVGGFGWSTIVLATPLILGLLVAHTRGVDVVRTVHEVTSAVRAAEPPAPPPDAPGAGAAVATAPGAAARSPDEPGSVPAGPRQAAVDLSVLAQQYEEEDGGSPTPGTEPETPRSVRRAPRRGCGLVGLVLMGALALGGAALAAMGDEAVVAMVTPGTGLVAFGGLTVATGLALAVGAWLGHDRGLVSLATLLVLFCVVMVTVDMTQLRFGGITWRPD